MVDFLNEFPFIIIPRVCFSSSLPASSDRPAVSGPLPIHINPLSLFISKIHRLSYTTKFTVICFNLKYKLLFYENPCICACSHLAVTFGLGNFELIHSGDPINSFCLSRFSNWCLLESGLWGRGLGGWKSGQSESELKASIWKSFESLHWMAISLVALWSSICHQHRFGAFLTTFLAIVKCCKLSSTSIWLCWSLLLSHSNMSIGRYLRFLLKNCILKWKWVISG